MFKLRSRISFETFALCLILLLTTGCVSSKTMMEGVEVPVEDMNNELTISAPPVSNTFAMGDLVTLAMVNNTDQPITITQETAVHLFTQQAETWLIIDNVLESGPSVVTLLPKSVVGSRSMFFLPDIMGVNSVTIRVIVVGLMDGREVAGYSDLVLNP